MNQTPFSAGPAQQRAGDQRPTQQAVYPAGPESVVDQNSDFNGRYQTSNNLRVEGRAQGEIRCSGTFLVAEQGKVNATVVAANVTIAGEYSGDVQCEGRFVLMPTARAKGRVQAGSLIVQEGALFSGEIRMVDPNAPQRPVAAPSARSTRAERASSSSSGANGSFGSMLEEPPGNGARAGTEATARTE